MTFTRDRDHLWETVEGCLCIAGYLTAVIANMWLPADVQATVPAVRAFTEAMAMWNPQVAFVGNMPIAGAKANQVVYAALWCVMPIYWAIFIRHCYRALKPGNFMFTIRSRGDLVALLLGLTLLLYLCLQPQGDTSSRLGQFLFGWKLTRALVAPWAVFAAGFMTILILRVLGAWVTGRVRYEPKAKRVP
jgi:hypothetical protein